jgi:hypothetical protein
VPRVSLPRLVSATNRIPDRSPCGSPNHRRISLPRAGKATSRTADDRRTRRRAVSVAGRTRILPTIAGLKPNHSRPRDRRTIRSFSSALRIVASMTVRSDFTSTTINARRSRRAAKTSIEPRSPNSEYVVSTATSQRAVCSRQTISPTSAACASSRSRSSAPPRQVTTGSQRASRAANTRRKVSPASFDPWPRSIREIVCCETPARAPSSVCVKRRRRRSARRIRPIRTSSTRRSSGWPLIRRLTGPRIGPPGRRRSVGPCGRRAQGPRGSRRPPART